MFGSANADSAEQGTHMLVYSATIDSREYPLASAAYAEELKSKILAASQGIGRYIDIRSSSHRTSSVLVNSSTAVAFDTHDTDESATVGIRLVDAYPDYEAP
jgi:hypothetical protein